MISINKTLSQSSEDDILIVRLSSNHAKLKICYILDVFMYVSTIICNLVTHSPTYFAVSNDLEPHQILWVILPNLNNKNFQDLKILTF